MTISRICGAALCAVLTAFSLTTLAQQTYLPGDRFSHEMIDGGSGPEMVVLREGQFVLGGGRVADAPQNLVVTIKRPFAVSTTEISAGLYRQFLEASKSGDLKDFDISDDTLPVSGISWDRAEAFVSWLSHQTGYAYGLPSSTQWEYAARAGSQKTYSWGDEVGEGNANCMACGVPFAGATAPVGSFKANNWGIHDMEGNVWEWTRDCIDPNSAPPLNGMPQLFGNCDSRELRGGSAESAAWAIRLNSRASAPRQARNSDVGIRVVMQLPR